MASDMSGTGDVLAVYPAEYKQEPEAPVRDALVGAQAALFTKYKKTSQYAADQANVARATRRYLDGQGEDRDVHRSGNEGDGPYRARVLAVPEVVTPLAIVAAVNAVLAPYTTIKAQYLESIQDRAYLRFHPPSELDDPVGRGCAILEHSPNYASRLYPEDEAVNGAARVQCSPGGAWLFGDRVGRYFVLRVPDLSPLDTVIPAMYFPMPGEPENLGGLSRRMFLRTTGSDPPKSFLYKKSTTALDVYGAIVSAVEAVIGHSVRWKMISDPKLR